MALHGVYCKVYMRRDRLDYSRGTVLFTNLTFVFRERRPEWTRESALKQKEETKVTTSYRSSHTVYMIQDWST